MSLLSMPATGATATTPADKEDSEDLFSAHDFDVQIDMTLPGIMLGYFSTFCHCQFCVTHISIFSMDCIRSLVRFSFLESRQMTLSAKSTPAQKEGGPSRRSLNLDEYKKRKGLI